MQKDIITSVIVPVYNMENFHIKCLDSFINQTIDNHQIIIVNDGYTDKSQIMIEEYTEKYPGKDKNIIKENKSEKANQFFYFIHKVIKS